MKKRLLSIALALCMCLSLLPVTAFAEGEATVTFYIKHGTWADGTTEPKTVTVQMYNGGGTLKLEQVPTGMKPDEGYWCGMWFDYPNLARGGIRRNEGYEYDFVPVPQEPAPPRKTLIKGASALRDPWERQYPLKPDFIQSDYIPSDYIWFGRNNGTDPIKWRILDTQYTYSSTPSLFLLSEYVIVEDGVYFCTAHPDQPGWVGSDAEAWCKDFSGKAGSSVPDALSGAELDALTLVHKDDKGDILWEPYPGFQSECVYFLSLEELNYITLNHQIIATDPEGMPGNWWLRTTHRYPLVGVGCITNEGKRARIDANTTCGARPACNVNPESVQFISAAVGGKPEELGLSAIQNWDGNEWKLTLKDKTRKDFKANISSTGEISYSGAKTGPNEYISALIWDNAAGEYTHYGKLVQLDGAVHGASGTAQSSLADLDLTGKTLYLFNEQCNGDKKTDYASPLRELQPGVFEDYLRDAAATAGKISSCVYDWDKYNIERTGEWTTHIRVERDTWICVDPESGPAGTILTGVKAVTASGREVNDWEEYDYRTDDNRVLRVYCLNGMPDEDLTITPIFDRVIDRADIRMPNRPLAGKTPQDVVLTVGEGAEYTVSTEWRTTDEYGNRMDLGPEDPFVLGKDYTAYITIKSNEGYAFRSGESLYTPADQKTQLYYNGKAVPEGDNIRPVCFGFSGDKHLMTLYVRLSAMPYGYEIHLDPNGMSGTAPAPLYRESADPNGTTITLPMETGLYDGDFEVVRWTTNPDGSGKSYAPGEAIVFPKGNASLTLYAQKGVLINEKNFPDPKFRAFLKGMTEGADGIFTPEEVGKMTYLSCRGEGIRDLSGIGYFTALETLNCAANQLETLDLGRNTKLTYLDCSYNRLLYLDLQHQSDLTELDCRNNQLMSLSLAGQTGHEKLTLRLEDNVRKVPNGAPLAELDPGFDISKVGTVVDGSFQDGKVIFDPDKTTVYYAYEVGRLQDGRVLTEAFALERSDVLTFEKVSAQKLLVSLPAKNTSATLVIASYDENGRMTGLRVEAIPSGALAKVYDIAENEKAFLLDSATSTPLCEALQG